MNVLFVYSLDSGILPDGLLSSQELIQFGISHISSLLKADGHQTELVVTSRRTERRSAEALRIAVEEFRPGLICFSAIATQYGYIAGLARDIKRDFPDIYLAIGGVHATLNPDEAITGDFDALCVGEGEQPVLELAGQLSRGAVPSGILNLWIKHGSAIEKNPPRPFLQELDELPFPDRSIWQRWMSAKSTRMASVLLSRGCPFDCSYCSNHALRKTAPGAYLRHRSPRRVIEEIQKIAADLPAVEEIYFETETLVSKREWSLELCGELERFNASRARPLTFGANIRIVPGQELGDIFAALKRANFRFVNIGLESGSERVRREVLRRNYSNDDVTNAVASARNHGLKVALFNLIGVPGETFDDFKETVRVNRLCRPDWHLTSIFFPYPGTDLYRSCVEKGLLAQPPDPHHEREKALYDLPGFSKREMEDGLRFFSHYIYKGYDPGDRRAVSTAYFWEVTVKRFHKKALRSLRRKAREFLSARR